MGTAACITGLFISSGVPEAAFFSSAPTQATPNHTATEIYLRLCEFVQCAWKEGDSRNIQADACSGLTHLIDALSGQLRGSQRLLRARNFCFHSQSQDNASRTSLKMAVTDPLVLAYIWAVVPRLQPGERLFHASTHEFRRELQSLIQIARFPAFRWHPYSSRRRGATAHYMEFGNLSPTMMRGRWASIKTARLYLNSVWQQPLRFPPLSLSNETLLVWHEEPDTRFFMVPNFEFTTFRVAGAPYRSAIAAIASDVRR